MKKTIFLLGTLIFTLNVLAQEGSNNDDKIVTLTVSGQGKTMEEAKQNALRSAIEQAFGVFISSKTEILNDKVAKDEIVSVSNGNIQSFEIISEVLLPDGGYATSLNTTISISKLTSFVESKGFLVELKGSLFAFNINQQILNEENELKAIKEIIEITLKIQSKSIYGRIFPKDPLLNNGNLYNLPFEINIHTNENINEAVKYFTNNLIKLSLKNTEVNDYLKLNKPVYEVILVSPSVPIDGKYSYEKSKRYHCPIGVPSYEPSDCNFISLNYRNKLSSELLSEFLLKSYNQIFNFKIITDKNLTLKIDEINQQPCKGSYDGNQKILLANGLIPFGSPSLNRGQYSLPVIFSNSDYLCRGSSTNNELFPTINKSLSKYLCERRFQYKNKNPYLIILLHQYQKDGLVYQLFGSSKISLSDLGKISSIKIEY
jgi:hypothetical protein